MILFPYPYILTANGSLTILFDTLMCIFEAVSLSKLDLVMTFDHPQSML
jgi:hypothetical protein